MLASGRPEVVSDVIYVRKIEAGGQDLYGGQDWWSTVNHLKIIQSSHFVTTMADKFVP